MRGDGAQSSQIIMPIMPAKRRRIPRPFKRELKNWWHNPVMHTYGTVGNARSCGDGFSGGFQSGALGVYGLLRPEGGITMTVGRKCVSAGRKSSRWGRIVRDWRE